MKSELNLETDQQRGPPHMTSLCLLNIGCCIRPSLISHGCEWEEQMLVRLSNDGIRPEKIGDVLRVELLAPCNWGATCPRLQMPMLCWKGFENWTHSRLSTRRYDWRCILKAEDVTYPQLHRPMKCWLDPVEWTRSSPSMQWCDRESIWIAMVWLGGVCIRPWIQCNDVIDKAFE